MNLACVQCRQPLPITATFCNSCGRPVDADKDGVPDALGNMIEAKARAIVAEEKRDREASLARDVAHRELEELTREDSALQVQLAENARLPRSWFGALFHTAIMTLVIGTMFWLVLGLPLHMWLFSILDVSPAGLVLCGSHCDTCSGPGRVYSWNFKGSWHEKNGQMGYALVCHNREIDVDKLTASDIRGSALNDRLQPYMISGVTAYAVEGLVLIPSTALVLGVVLAARRRAFDVERTTLTEQQRKNRERRAARGAPVAETDTFRG